MISIPGVLQSAAFLLRHLDLTISLSHTHARAHIHTHSHSSPHTKRSTNTHVTHTHVLPSCTPRARSRVFSLTHISPHTHILPHTHAPSHQCSLTHTFSRALFFLYLSHGHTFPHHTHSLTHNCPYQSHIPLFYHPILSHMIFHTLLSYTLNTHTPFIHAVDKNKSLSPSTHLSCLSCLCLSLSYPHSFLNHTVLVHYQTITHTTS
jgi:hypothetical protein